MQAEAKRFFDESKADFRDSNKADIVLLETVHDVSRLSDPEVAKYLKNKFLIKITRQAYTLLKF